MFFKKKREQRRQTIRQYLKDNIKPFKVATTIYTQSPFLQGIMEEVGIPLNPHNPSGKLPYFIYDGKYYWTEGFKDSFRKYDIPQITFDDFLEKYLL